jgi:hypothetical protein
MDVKLWAGIKKPRDSFLSRGHQSTNQNNNMKKTKYLLLNVIVIIHFAK